MRRSIVHALARLRVISSAEDGLARDSASLLGASGFTGQSSTLQHSVQQALDVGKGSGSVVQQWRQPNMHGRGTVLTSSLVVSDASSAGSTARCYCAVPGKTDSGPIHVAAVSSDHSSSSSGSREQVNCMPVHGLGLLLGNLGSQQLGSWPCTYIAPGCLQLFIHAGSPTISDSACLR